MAKCQGSVLSRVRIGTWLAACLLSTFTALPVAAQAPKGDSPLGPGVFGSVVDRATTIESQGLDNPALRLTSAQQAQIDKAISAYVEERRKLAEKYPPPQKERPSAEAIMTRQAAFVTLTTALGKVMDDEQRKIWRTAQAARIQPPDPNGWRLPGK